MNERSRRERTGCRIVFQSLSKYDVSDGSAAACMQAVLTEVHDVRRAAVIYRYSLQPPPLKIGKQTPLSQMTRWSAAACAVCLLLSATAPQAAAKPQTAREPCPPRCSPLQRLGRPRWSPLPRSAMRSGRQKPIARKRRPHATRRRRPLTATPPPSGTPPTVAPRPRRCRTAS